MSPTPVRLAASISMTSTWRSWAIAVHWAQTPQGDGVGPPAPSGPTQFSARAMMRAVVVLPTPRTPGYRQGPAKLVERMAQRRRSEEHTSELQSLMRISYAVFCLKKKKNIRTHNYKKNVETHE